MNTNVLVILGNGYDVAQGFPSRYKDFYDGSTDLKVYANNGNNLCKHIIDTYNSEDTQWSDLEEGLYLFSLQLTKKNGEGNKAVAERFEKEFNELRFGWCDIEQIGVKGFRNKCSLALSLSKRFNVDILDAWKKMKCI